MRRVTKWAALALAVAMAAAPVVAMIAAASLHGWRKFAVIFTANIAMHHALPMVRDAWTAR